jgi:RNA polymerase-associated protein RTF1
MLKRKSQLQGDVGKPQANWATLERARLTQARTLALRRNDKAEVAILDGQLAELAVESPPVQLEQTEDVSALLAKVNERNRKSNLEAIRRAELLEAERKRRERRLGTPTVFDPSARLRTVPRMFASRYGYQATLRPKPLCTAELRLKHVYVQVYYAKPRRVAGARRVIR